MTGDFRNKAQPARWATIGTATCPSDMHGAEPSGAARAPGFGSGRVLGKGLALGVLALVAACGTMDRDLRGGLGGFSTADAARNVSASRPQPDNRGVISYPNYQIAVARQGDTVADVAARVGLAAGELARYNGLNAADPLNTGAVLALPVRVQEPSPATGAAGTGPILSPADVDLTNMAGSAIARAADKEISVATLPASPTGQPARQVGAEPIRHQVVRGETVYTIARLYGVSVRSLAQWNGLDSNFTIREGQYLIIPLVPDSGASASAASVATGATVAPGVGSPTPTPPSASAPLPSESPEAIQSAPPSVAPDLGGGQKAGGKLGYPVQGSIIRAYAKGRNDGIDISAPAGTPVKAAEAGTVAAIIQDSDNQSVVVVKHSDNLLTLYSNVADITVKKGDSVTRGQSLAKIPTGTANYVHFEVRKGLDSVDPEGYLK
ncbi:LysM peptidoglycan-binding domain-containing protein [Pseudooceanicola sp. HF7]|uniref:LysM peptidoglycan-binding domain-containing protein n=1 Tax=Pseudooceanicola sp. HF7 TaxID=2721560 RepID=UPI0020CA4F3D|nr:LysM peptidoglycan-binding domain-containing protein [Pseudooceanicola sp. HF7]